MLIGNVFLCCLLWQQPALATQARAFINEAQTQVWQGNQLLLDARRDGFLSVKSLSYSPDAKHFAVIGCGFECNDNPAWVFNADSSGKTQFAQKGDFVLREGIEWSADGQTLYYFRTGSTAVRTPKPAVGPRQGWMAFSLKTLNKTVAVQRSIDRAGAYRIFNLRDGNHLLLRSNPDLKSASVLTLPARAKGITLTGKQQVVNRENWVEADYQNHRGWLLHQVLIRDY